MSLFKEKILILILILFLFFLGIFILRKDNNIANQNLIFFKYPENDIEFAGKKIPDINNNYLIKERFDKEFLNVSYNLYQFFLYIKRIPLYIPYIENELKKAGLPDDLKYLPIAESALRNDIVSPAGRAGIWQFMMETAKEYGLIVTDEIDERYHIEKSTSRAIKYLTYLYNKFGDWPLALASYNRGHNAISNALIDQNVDNYFDLYLNEETSRYFFKILAIKYVLKDYENKKDLIDKIIGGLYKPLKTKEIKVGAIHDLKKWAKENNQNFLEIKTLNTWIRKDYLPDGEWVIKIIDK